jgi:translation initiation factor IF-2
MALKLIKVAKDLNVGLHTIVETLRNKGFSNLEEKPTAEITDDMMAVLQKEFQKDLAIKQEADKLLRTPVKREPVATPTLAPLQPLAPLKPLAPAEPPAPAPVPTPAPAPVAPVVTAQPEAKVEPPQPQQPPQPEVVKRELPSLRIVGKVDLEPKKPAPKPTPKEVKPVAPPAPKEAPEASKPAPAKPTEAPAVKPSAPPPADKPATPAPAADAVTPAAPEDEFYRADSPQLRGLKVMGKINLETRTNDSGGGGGRRDGRGGRGGNNQSGGGDRRRQDGTAPATGGTNSNSESERQKRKRKQIQKPITAESLQQSMTAGGNNDRRGGGGGGQGQNRPGGGQGQGQGGQNRQGGGQGQGGQNRGPGQGGGQGQGGQNRGPGQGGQNRGPGQGGQNRGPGQGGQNRGGARGPSDGKPTEISQKDIDNQIRQTMARMGAGASRKRQKIRRDKRSMMRERADQAASAANESGKLQVTEFISAADLASLMNVKPADIIKACMSLGVFVSINQRLDAEIIELVTSEFGFEVQFISAEEQLEVEEEVADDPKDLKPRQPIVTVMGHVDHGKTSLLDFIRNANVVSGEAGGITQHIGAYEVMTGEGDEAKKITFLDTPGHEAFTAMRARGAKVTDIAIIVIAADDSIMPQTREAISHAQAAGVPMVFAINKIDKAGADPERIKNELAQMNLLVEEWGGKYQSQDISAKKGINVDKLLEKVILEAEILELKANPTRRASGTVLEASMEKGRGYVTKILVDNGTISKGDPIIAGEHSGRVRAMFNDRGKEINKAGPSTPVLVLGLAGAPQAGERIKVAASESEAKEIATKRAQILREQANRATKRISLDEIGRRLALGNFKELKLIVKGDVDGSVEALSDSLIKLSMDKIQVSVIHKAVGQIVDSDIMLASASDAIIVGFQVRPSLTARKLAEREGVEIKTYSIIYEAIEEITAAMEGMLDPVKEEEIMGQIEIRELFKIPKIGVVAGCIVQEGKVTRNYYVRVIRDGIVTYPVNQGQHAELSSLKRFKEDAKEVRAGLECGLTIRNYNDLKVGDTLEVYTINEVKAKL